LAIEANYNLELLRKLVIETNYVNLGRVERDKIWCSIIW